MDRYIKNIGKNASKTTMAEEAIRSMNNIEMMKYIDELIEPLIDFLNKEERQKYRSFIISEDWKEGEKFAKQMTEKYSKKEVPKHEPKETRPESPKDTRKLRAMLSELYDDLRHDMTEAEQYKYNRLHRDEKFESLYEFMLEVKERIKIDNVKKEEAEHHRRKKEQEEWEESRKKAEAKKAEDAIRVKKEIDELLKSLPKESPIPKAKKGKAKKRTMITKAVVARKEMPHDSHKGRWTKEELYHFYNEHKYIPPFKNGNPRKVTIEQLNTYMRKPAWKRRPKGKANEHFKKVKSSVSEDNLFYA